jgi:hypothetical protein
MQDSLDIVSDNHGLIDVALTSMALTGITLTILDFINLAQTSAL